MYIYMHINKNNNDETRRVIYRGETSYTIDYHT